MEVPIRGDVPEVAANDLMTKTEFYGNEIIDCKYRLNLKYAYSAGKIVSRDVLEQVYHRTLYNLLRIDPSERSILLSKSVGTPRKDQEWNLQVMFEWTQAPRCCIVPQTTLALLSTGRTTGFVIESGCGVTQFSPIYEGCALQPGSVMIELGGRTVFEVVGSGVAMVSLVPFLSTLSRLSWRMSQERRMKKWRRLR